ncbi:MAG: fumarate hydratase [Candidatus Lokiarchaeota archaeon]|nr:fumarate hydratase [Candidatus Lokiarchaeota archaeon]
MIDRNLSSLSSKIEDALLKIIKKATTEAPNEVIDLINKTLSIEDSELTKSQLELILENFSYAAKNKIPICQDTGVLNFFIELGSNFPLISDYKEIIKGVVRRASKIIPLRGNSVDPITNKNPENNIGEDYPPIYLKIINNKNNLKITVLPKGGGAENISRLFMLNPSDGLDNLQIQIINIIKKAGGMPCPPIILGIGIGGDATYCMNLAKKALMRPLNTRHIRNDVASIELELLEKINQLNIGTMGLGGKITCLDVHIEVTMRHPASYPVGLIVQCYSHRYASFEMNKKGEITNEI